MVALARSALLFTLLAFARDIDAWDAPEAAAVAAVVPSISPKQRSIVAAIRPRAVSASARATPELLAELGAPPFRAELRRQLRGTGAANEALAAAPSEALLQRLRAEVQASEIVHNLAIWSAGDRGSRDACPASDCGWSSGNAQGAPRTPAFLRPQLDNLWLLGVHNMSGKGKHTQANESFVPPATIVGWLAHPSKFEHADIGCDAFTGSVACSSSPYCRPGQRRSAPGSFPASIDEAAQRPVYGILDLKKLDVGATDFGPVGIVFNRSKLDRAAIFMLADTGQWSCSCNVSEPCRGKVPKAASRCCIVQVTRNGTAPVDCPACAENSACCTNDRSYNCSAWSAFGNAPGVVGHIDHIIITAVRMWNDTVTVNGTTTYKYRSGNNLATLLARSVASLSNAKDANGPKLQVHNNYYVEANLLATPQFAAQNGDVLFVIGQFPFLFGTDRGEQLQTWAKQWNFPIVWGLGPADCYEQINQTGGKCDEHHWSPSLGAGEPAYSGASSRVLDPVACAAATDSAAAKSLAAQATFKAAWGRAATQRKNSTFNASAAWSALTAVAGVGALRVSAVSAGRCDQLDSIMAVTLDSGTCVRSVRLKADDAVGTHSACIEYTREVARHAVPSLNVSSSADLKLKANVYGVGGHTTTMQQCLLDGAAAGSFGWNWTRGKTTKACDDPEGAAGCKTPGCFADFSFAGVSYGVSPFGGTSVGATSGVMPINLSALASFTVTQNVSLRWTDTAPGAEPPPTGGARRIRFIYDMFIASARPNGSSVASSITDEITISLAGNVGFPGSQPPGCLDPSGRFGNVSRGGPVLRNAVRSLGEVYDYEYTDHHDAVPNDGSRYHAFRRVGSESSGDEASVPAAVDLVPFLAAVKSMWAGVPLPFGPWLGEVTLATELYDHQAGRVVFASVPTFTPRRSVN